MKRGLQSHEKGLRYRHPKWVTGSQPRLLKLIAISKGGNLTIYNYKTV